MNVIFGKILNELNEERYTTSNEISMRIGKSDKTVRNKINELNSLLLTNGAQIRVVKGSGYILEVNDRQAYEVFLKESLVKNFGESSKIIQSIIKKLVQSRGYVRAEELTEEYFISRSTLTKYLSEIKLYLSQYNLVLETKPHYGMKIIGTEFDLRRFIASIFSQNYLPSDFYATSDITSQEVRRVYNTVRSIIEKEIIKRNFNIASIALDSLITHISLSILRSKYESIISLDESLVLMPHDNPILGEIDSIISTISDELNVTLPDSERIYISMHFQSKLTMDYFQTSAIPQEVNILVDSILEEIKNKRDVDLGKDLELRTLLGLHLVPLIYRLRFGTYLKNPILDEVKRSCIKGYDLAIIASKRIEDTIGSRVNDDEISYIAMHFDVSLSRLNSPVSKKNVLIVCSTGRASGQVLKQKFIDHFSQSLKSIQVCDIHEIEYYESHVDFDFIFTTVPLTCKTKAPIFEFEFFLNHDTVQSIGRILNDDLSKEKLMEIFKRDLFFVTNKTDKIVVLNDFIDSVMNIENYDESFRDLVWERENYSSTDILESIAVPHPNKLIAEKSCVACLVLDKPILWGKNEVSIVFLMSLSKRDSEKYTFIYDLLIKLASRQDTVYDIQSKQSYDALIDSLIKLF